MIGLRTVPTPKLVLVSTAIKPTSRPTLTLTVNTNRLGLQKLGRVVGLGTDHLGEVRQNVE